ncbi:hypothetical protein [Streptomyces sp. st115]|uniref:hypothetical protein n=1 Tax=Streptomyces sp. st115 TaxID=1828047 RepID=UPI0015CF293F|nr:hypothetical protein [Streptomyces sp. st115]
MRRLDRRIRLHNADDRTADWFAIWFSMAGSGDDTTSYELRGGAELPGAETEAVRS